MEQSLPTEELASLYRFALLLTGSGTHAADAVLAACAECAPRLESYRNAAGRTACLLTHVREACARKKAGAPPAGEAPSAAGKIAALPEPERTAMALFYTARLPMRELAALLKISIEEFSAALESGRGQLRTMSRAEPAAATGIAP